jgi:hypothetical protein
MVEAEAPSVPRQVQSLLKSVVGGEKRTRKLKEFLPSSFWFQYEVHLTHVNSVAFILIQSQSISLSICLSLSFSLIKVINTYCKVKQNKDGFQPQPSNHCQFLAFLIYIFVCKAHTSTYFKISFLMSTKYPTT